MKSVFVIAVGLLGLAVFVNSTRETEFGAGAAALEEFQNVKVKDFLEVEGSGSVAGGFKVGGDLNVTGKVVVNGVEIQGSAPSRPLESTVRRVIFRGVSESDHAGNMAVPIDHHFQGSHVQGFTFEVAGSKRIIAAYPIAKEFHLGEVGNIGFRCYRWWTPQIAVRGPTNELYIHDSAWAGYFGASIQQPNKVEIAGSPQPRGIWPVDVFVLYEK